MKQTSIIFFLFLGCTMNRQNQKYEMIVSLCSSTFSTEPAGKHACRIKSYCHLCNKMPDWVSLLPSLIKISMSLQSLAALFEVQMETHQNRSQFSCLGFLPCTSSLKLYFWNTISNSHVSTNSKKMHKLYALSRAFENFWVSEFNLCCLADIFYDPKFRRRKHLAIAHLHKVKEPKTGYGCPLNLMGKKGGKGGSPTHTMFQLHRKFLNQVSQENPNWLICWSHS